MKRNRSSRDIEVGVVILGAAYAACLVALICWLA